MADNLSFGLKGSFGTTEQFGGHNWYWDAQREGYAMGDILLQPRAHHRWLASYKGTPLKAAERAPHIALGLLYQVHGSLLPDIYREHFSLFGFEWSRLGQGDWTCQQLPLYALRLTNGSWESYQDGNRVCWAPIPEQAFQTMWDKQMPLEVTTLHSGHCVSWQWDNQAGCYHLGRTLYLRPANIEKPQGDWMTGCVGTGEFWVGPTPQAAVDLARTYPTNYTALLCGRDEPPGPVIKDPISFSSENSKTPQLEGGLRNTEQFGGVEWTWDVESRQFRAGKFSLQPNYNHRWLGLPQGMKPIISTATPWLAVQRLAEYHGALPWVPHYKDLMVFGFEWAPGGNNTWSLRAYPDCTLHLTEDNTWEAWHHGVPISRSGIPEVAFLRMWKKVCLEKGWDVEGMVANLLSLEVGDDTTWSWDNQVGCYHLGRTLYLKQLDRKRWITGVGLELQGEGPNPFEAVRSLKLSSKTYEALLRGSESPRALEIPQAAFRKDAWAKVDVPVATNSPNTILIEGLEWDAQGNNVRVPALYLLEQGGKWVSGWLQKTPGQHPKAEGATAHAALMGLCATEEAMRRAIHKAKNLTLAPNITLAGHTWTWEDFQCRYRIDRLSSGLFLEPVHDQWRLRAIYEAFGAPLTLAKAAESHKWLRTFRKRNPADFPPGTLVFSDGTYYWALPLRPTAEPKRLETLVDQMGALFGNPEKAAEAGLQDPFFRLVLSPQDSCDGCQEPFHEGRPSFRGFCGDCVER